MININIEVNMLDNLKQHFINKERDKLEPTSTNKWKY